MAEIVKPWYVPRVPEEVEATPWLHPEAVAFLEELIGPDWLVLEHGSGGSTLWFARRVAKVVSIEHDLAWREKIRERASANVTLLDGLPRTQDSPRYHLLMVDGQRDERGRCLDLAKYYLRGDGWVVLDNANRPEYADQRRGLFGWAKLKARFDNNTPHSKYFVTEFWCASG